MAPLGEDTEKMDGLQAMRSQLTYQLEQERHPQDINHGSDDLHLADQERATSRSPPRPRPWSSHESRSALSPSPLFVEPAKTSKDDSHVAPGPVTPKRPNFPQRGLSLQMPPRDISSTSTANITKRIPLSPKLDSTNSYAPTASVLPRRSRGMDFSRACTNLHHSTLAEQSSPDSSPIIGGRGMMIPPRKSLFNNTPNASHIPDSPVSVTNSLWSTMANTDKPAIASSVGSVSLMEYDTGSSSSDSDDLMDHTEEEDTIHMTPHVFKDENGSMNFGPPIMSSPGGNVIGSSPVVSKMMSYQRARLKPGRVRKSSSNSSSHSRGPASPPLLKSIESSLSSGYFSKEPSKKDIGSRRESLSLGTGDLRLSDCEDSDGCSNRGFQDESLSSSTPVTPSIDERRNVIRRAVTRRGNMLPKTKNFARIRAALLEEGAPVDTEVKREAEVVRQVRESDGDGDITLTPSQPTTTASSPSLLPLVATQSEGLEDIPENSMVESDLLTRRRSSSTFTHQAIRNSGGLGFWNNFDERMRTPPPQLNPRGSSSGISDDVNMDTPLSSIQPNTLQYHRGLEKEPSACYPSPQPLVTNFEVSRKGNKRMRDDDFDPNYFKRRAVSPGMSLQNSPILPQSPLQRDTGWWGTQPKNNRETPSVQVVGERVSSGGSASSGSGTGGSGSKRVGFQGMCDTNDGLMNMSIE